MGFIGIANRNGGAHRPKKGRDSSTNQTSLRNLGLFELYNDKVISNMLRTGQPGSLDYNPYWDRSRKF